MIGIKNQCFGMEIEFTGITRKQAAETLAAYFETQPLYFGSSYDTWGVEDPQGRTWKFMSDSSIRPEKKSRGRYIPTTELEYRVEFVTPKLNYEDMCHISGRRRSSIRDL